MYLYIYNIPYFYLFIHLLPGKEGRTKRFGIGCIMENMIFELESH